MTLSETTCLSGIERNANWLRKHSLDVAFYVRELPTRPDFETKAEDMLVQAERELTAALERVREARAEFNTKPVAA